MTIFSNDKIVVGLFDRMSDTAKIVDTLYQHGFGDDVRVIDKTSLESNLSDTAAPVAVQPTNGSGSLLGVPITPGSDSTIDDTETLNKKYIQDELTNAGIDPEQASFYAEHVTRGSALVMVEADKSHIAEAKNILEQSDRVRTVVSS